MNTIIDQLDLTTRDQHLEFCRVCRNQKFDAEKGIICGLTDRMADFQGFCPSYVEDADLKSQYETQRIATEVTSKIASHGKRLANFLLDLIFYLAFLFLVAVVMGIIEALTNFPLTSFFDSENQLDDNLFLIACGILYYGGMEALTKGRTIAKFITRTKVVMNDGATAAVSACFIRALCRFIPFEVFSFLGSSRTGWHDTIAKTVVVEI